ncbi:non-ribosomal peptide synthetase [Pseudomonas aeruginosa]
MNAEDSLKLARRFIELPVEKRRVFLETLRGEGIDFSLFPIPAGVSSAERDRLSYAQQRMWFLWHLEPQSGAYNLPSAVRLNGPLDRQALERAFASLVQRHEALRTVFPRGADDSLAQAPLQRPLEVAFEDCSGLPEAEQEARLREEAQRESLQPFDLCEGPLLRVRLIRLGEERHVLLLTLHHIVSDGWSMNVLIEEFSRFYSAYATGAEPGLPALPIQYADYALWQRSWLEAGEQERQLEYWRGKLGERHPVLELPTDHPRPAVPSYRGSRYEFSIEPALAEALRGTARRQGLTLFMLLLGGFNILLQRYSGQTDLRVGVPIANRNRAEVEGLIGLFVNTQVLRSVFDGRTSVATLLAGLKDTVLGAQAHQDLPFERLVEAFKVERSLSHSPLFQVMYNHQPLVADIEALDSVAGLSFGQLDWKSRTTQFDLSLDTYEKGGRLYAALTYATDLFEARTVERMARHWQNLLRGMLENPQASVDSLPMLDAEERYQLLEGWNATAAEYPLQRGVHRLFEEQVERTPTAPALAFGEERLDYAELNRRANRLAHALIERGIGADRLVGVAMERSIEMVVALMAILKAGGAYVPVDPEYPEERQAYMLEDSGVQLLLSQSHLKLPLAQGVQRIDLDQADAWLENHAENNPGVELNGENLAYVIYTSGSTGKPKGAGNRHSALSNRLCWMQQAYGLGVGDTVLQKTPFSFDVSVWEFFWPLMSGARLVVAAPGDHRDPAKLVALINREGVDTLHFVPSMLQAFLQDEDVASCTSLKRIVCSGEALPADAQQQVFAKLPQAGLYNLYGPTEAAIDVTHWTCVEEGKDAVPIGRPIANLACYILDGNLEPVPVGVLGELYLAGRGLARGYHQRPGLTAERFVASPFVAGERMYRTGDLARYRADGVIEYAGRIDHQVKLRGLRIELGEIEARLLEHPWVREAAVLAVDGRQLVGYVVLESEGGDWREALAAHLATSLPEYMVPAQWLALERMPLSPNGKLDRKALPAPEVSVAQAGYSAPRNAVERTLAEIWQDLLGVERVGLDDNFFSLGGDSIVSIQVVSRARQAGLQLSPRDLFQHQNIRSLALAAKAGAATAEQGPASGEVALAPVQRWFFERAIPNRQHWNQSLLLQARQPLDGDRLGRALERLQAQHDALRLRFREERGAWHQAYAEQAGEPLWRRQAGSEEALLALCEEAQRSLDLEQGPLLRALLVDMADGSQRLLLVIHHLAVDGVSWRILLEDLQRLYADLDADLGPRSSSYQAWSRHLHEQAGARLDELDYWQAQLHDAPHALPCENPHGALENRHERKLVLTLDAERTRQLLQEAPAAYRTQVNDLLLTALARATCRWSGDASVLVQLEGHGREDLGEAIDLSRTVGWFTSLFPLRLTPAADLGESLKAIKEQLRCVPDKGVGYGLLRYLAGEEAAARLAALPQPRITFNYLGRFDRQFDGAALLVPATESAGAAQDPCAPLANWLSIEGQVYGGELSLHWSFSREMFAEATVQRLVDDYARELHALIEHCLDPRHRGVTPSDFPLAGLSQTQLDELSLDPDSVRDIYPLSPMQQGMLFHSLHGTEGDYVNQLRMDIGGLDPDRFRAAWQATLDAHEILRSGFLWKDGWPQPLQVVFEQATLELRLAPPGSDPQRQAEAEREAGFDPARAPLQRLVLVPLANGRMHLIYTYHHILMDGWSNAQLLAEVLQRYAGQEVAAPVGRYRDYIGWLQSRDAKATESFWRDRLASLEMPTRLARQTRTEQPGQGEHLRELDPQTTRQLASFAQGQKVTLNTLVQAAWALLLQRHCGQETVAFGATVAGRPAELPGIEAQIGLFINTLPVITAPQPQQSVADYLQGMQALNLALREHEHTPLYDIQRWAGHGGEALFDSILVFENFPVAEALRQAPADLEFSTPSNHEQTNYPLTLGVTLGERLSLQYVYARRDFDAADIAELDRHLLHLLQRMAETPQAALGELALLDAGERQEALRDWQAPLEALPRGGVAAAFAHQAASAPEAIALVCGDEHLSYAELDMRAERLARGLRARGVAAEALVAIAAERSFDLVVGLLGILKAGAGYLPLDPNYPAERLAYMLRDSGARWLICQETLAERLPCPAEVERLPLETAAWPASADTRPLPEVAGETLAYVIYTSGSTGQPKGVAVSQAALVAHCQAAARTYGVGPGDCQLQFASISFDAAAEQLFVPLLAGARVLLGDAGQWSAQHLADEVERHAVTILDLPPAYLQQQAEELRHAGRRIAVRACILGGEAWDASLLTQQAVQAEAWFNAYGPTEAVITPLAWHCRTQEGGAPAIGRALGARRACILDAALQPCAPGMIGELYIGGQCLARGYLGRPGQTAERFVADPFSGSGERLYRTGDLARYRVDGQVEYLGRADQQIKIRGFRIEIGEIESQLLAHPYVAEAAVVAQDGVGGPLLAAYLVGRDAMRGEDLLAELRTWLAGRLPAYMQPTAWQVLSSLPLNANGKLDRKALPKVDAAARRQAGEPPREGLERSVAAIWEALLGVEGIARDEHFFELGGHSLSATRVVSRLRQDLELDVPLRILFERPVLADFAASLESQAASAAPVLQVLPRVAELPLSHAQQRMWFLWKLEPESAAYHLPSVLHVRGVLDRAALQQAFDWLVLRHETLRTRFEEVDGQARQTILANMPLRIVLEDCAGASEATLRQRVAEEIRQPFDLARGPLLRVRLLALAGQEHVLVITQHHIVSDGWSMQVMVDELLQAYAAARRGEQPTLAPLTLQYADYAAWHRAWLDSGEGARQLDYWRERLGAEQPVLELPADRVRPAQASGRGQRLDMALPVPLSEELLACARREGVTPFMLLLASFQVLLKRYSGQSDIRVGVPIANRNRAEVERLIGFFVNTQVLRCQVDAGLAFRDLLGRVREAALGAQAHQDLPFEQLVDALQPERNLSHSPLFQVMYNHQSGERQDAQVDGLHIESFAWDGAAAQFDLALDTWETPDGLGAALTYATDLFEARTVERMARHWQNLLRGMLENPQASVDSLPMLDAEERYQLLEGWNATAAEYPLQRGVHRLFEEQVERTPTAPALAFGEERLDYAELNRRANRLAHALIERGVGADRLVGVAMERSIEMVVALMAILKAGGAYVPVDPEYPEERQAYMLEDSGVQLLLSQSHLKLSLAQGVQRIDLDRGAPWFEDYSEANPDIHLDGENLAYVIYTSGSTGKPKGAGNRHSALSNRLCWMQQAYGLGVGDTVLQKTPFSFDVSVWEFFWPLMSGARLVVAAPGDHRDPAKLVELINREGVDTLHFVPSMLQAFLQDEDVVSCTSLKRIVCSGEALPADAQQQVFAKLPQAGLYNLYGPTEAAIDVTHWTCVEEGKDAVPIGRPIANLACYILDGNLEPVPVGVLGELYLAGQGLARGYHQRPGLTAERFVASPFVAGERMYRTGDLARYRADGVIEYAGRIDHQVKLRGLRIELGEIEARLLEHPWVREAAVLAVDGRQLVGYVVLESEGGDWREALAAHLATSLPEYMVPAQWLALERMPLSPNGKLDRKALPRPQAAAGQTHVAPQNEMERRIAAVWADVLKLEEVGATDNFFALGGDSIVSIQVVSRCRAAGIQFTPKDLFQQQTVQGLARVARVGAAVQMEQGPVSGETVLLPFQRLFFEQPIPNRQHWNQSLLLKPREALNAKALEAALQALVEHHDALRLRFHETDGTWHAEHAEATLGGALLWRAEAVDRQALESLCEESQRSLDLADGPLLRSLLVDMADGGQRLLLVIHHLVVDGVSWRILLEDLQRAYQQSLRGEAPRLPGKTSPFKAWAGRVSEHARGESMKAQLQFWRELLEGAPAELPCEHPQGALEQRFATSVQSRFDRSLTERLLKQAPAAYRTQVNDLLLTALARVVCRWSGASSSLVQLEGHGREELFADIDLSRTVGWFTSLFPVRLSPVADLGESLKAIKEQLRAIPDKGLGYGLLRYLAGEESARVLAGLPQARITFNYLGQFDAQFDEMALLDPAGESAGAEMDPGAPLDNWLSLNGRVFDGELSIDWSFSSQMFGEDQVRRLADDYVAELTALVDFCCDSPRHGATPSDFPLAGLDQARLDALPVALEEVEDIYPLSPMQQGMLFHSLYEQASSDYINQMRVDVSGLDIPRFRAAWQSALDRHAILRSGFAWQGELQQPLQIVYRQRQLPFAEEDLSQAANRDAALLALAAAERERGFELQRAPLLRLLLVKTAEGEHHLIYTHHHILLDGWSNAQLLSEVLESYAGRSPEQLRDGRYSDYIAWLQRQDAAATEAFWREQMAALDEPTRLVEALAQPGLTSANGVGEHLRELDATATARLRDFARRHQVTLNTLVQAGWALLLQRYTGQHTVVFGATVSGRPADLPGVENQVGLFINTLPVVVTLAPQMTLDELLQGLQRQNLALREQEHTPLFELQRWAGFGGEAVFDNLLVFENYPVDEVLERSSVGGVRFGAVAMHEQTNYPLALALGGGDSLSLQFSYDRGLFPAATIERLGRHLTTLLEAFAEHPQRRLVDLQMLEKAELSAIGAIWNRSDSGYPATPLVHQRVAERARMAPDAVAVIFDEEKLTYAELDSRANRLAHALIARGVGPEVRVAIAMQRSAEIMVAFLAVLKAGGAYVPLDIEYPRERLLYMMQDSRAHLLLTHSHLLERLPIPEGLSCLSVDREEEWAGFPAHDPEVALHGDNLAYVIYTSGSTGMPKGVAVSHGPLIAHIVATGERYEMTPEDCELHFMSFAFDGSHEGWMHPLINGARVLIRDDSLWLPERTYAEMHRHGVTVGVFPPVYLQQLAEHAERDGNPPPVRVYCFGGDAVAQASYDLAWRALKPKYLFNGYGPTETVVTPLLWKARAGDACGAAYMPIGTLLGNRSGYILDGQLNLLPVGVAGELYLGGEGVARGYLERPALTAERFVPDPFGAPGSRLYRSGDLTRGRADGVVDYLGRVDHQVKIRGFRIELGEIEARLREHPAVREAVVVAQPGAVGQQLVGYVVAQEPAVADSPEAQAECRAQLKTALRERLPEYMVPSHLLFLARMPLTPNGKLDRKGLPQPDASLLQQVYVAPRSDLEQQVAGIWAEVLQLQQVGLDDNFFELGGHSLLAIQVTARMQSEVGVELPLAALFQTESLQAYAELAAAQTSSNDTDFDDLREFMSELEAI